MAELLLLVRKLSHVQLVADLPRWPHVVQTLHTESWKARSCVTQRGLGNKGMTQHPALATALLPAVPDVEDNWMEDTYSQHQQSSLWTQGLIVLNLPV